MEGYSEEELLGILLSLYTRMDMVKPTMIFLNHEREQGHWRPMNLRPLNHEELIMELRTSATLGLTFSAGHV